MWLLATAVVLTKPDPLLHEFVADYRARLTNVELDRRDPAIERAMDVLIKVARRKSPNDNAWIKEFQRATGHSQEMGDNNFGSLTVSISSNSGRKVIVACMGFITRSAMFSRGGRRITLPPDLTWNRWYPHPVWLRHGLVLFAEDLVGQQGMRVGEKFVWLRPEGGRAIEVGSREGKTTLDYEGVQVKGDRVFAKMADDPQSLQQSMSTFVLERDITWRYNAKGPNLIRSYAAQKGLRAADVAIYEAWHTKKPSPTQERIRKLVDRKPELDSWKEYPEPNGVTRLNLNGDVGFEFRNDKSGRLRLTKVFPIKRQTKKR